MEWVAYHSPVCADGKYYPEGFFIYKREVLQRGYPSQPDFNKNKSGMGEINNKLWQKSNKYKNKHN